MGLRDQHHIPAPEVMQHYPSKPYTCTVCGKPVPAHRLCWCNVYPSLRPKPKRPRIRRPYYRYSNPR